MFFFFFKQKTAYEMRISDWSSDVCSSDLEHLALADELLRQLHCQPRRGEIADRRQQAFFSESFHQMVEAAVHLAEHVVLRDAHILEEQLGGVLRFQPHLGEIAADRKSTRLNSSH